MLLGC
jgi:hypothetical protein